MKNLEKHFKKILENHEMPYNEKAWYSLKTKLDTKSSLQNKHKIKIYSYQIIHFSRQTSYQMDKNIIIS